jgi:hypothetical protein
VHSDPISITGSVLSGCWWTQRIEVLPARRCRRDQDADLEKWARLVKLLRWVISIA